MGGEFLRMDLKKIFILEEENIIALDIKNILDNAGLYLPIIIKYKEDIFSLILDERPELIIVSSNVDKKISKEIFFIGKKLQTQFILLSTNSHYSWNQQTNMDFYNEVIYKPFSNEILIKSVENLLKPTSLMFANA